MQILILTTKILIITLFFGSDIQLISQTNLSLKSDLMTTQTTNIFDTNIEIWTEKDVFLTQERIWIYYKVINNSEKGPRISPLIEHDFIFRDSKGNKYDPKGFISVGDVKPMKKGEVYTAFLDMTDIYGELHAIRYGLFPPDKYTLQCIWKEAGYEPIVSNTLNIIIKEPGGEELDALNLYREARRLLKIEKAYPEAEKKFDELVERYPQSVYAEKALGISIFLRTLVLKDRRIILKKSKKFLENYPDSPETRNVIHYLKRCYELDNNLEGARMYLENLYDKTPSEKLKKMIYKHLERNVKK